MTAEPELSSIAQVAPLLQSRAVSPVDLVKACLARIDARPTLNAFITRLDGDALEAARRAEAEIQAGRYRGPLHGIPVSIKDLIDVAGTRTTAGAALPAAVARQDAPVVWRLREAGAIVIGKTNLHEFAFGTTSDESAFGPVRNPHDETRSAGGSSGGAAAALAAGMCLGALGTDTGGSIRIPAAACGVYGLKPTYGEVSAKAVIQLSASLDHVGPMARSAADLALLLHVLKGTPPRKAGDPGRYVIGVPRPYFCDRLEDGVALALAQACEALGAAGHTVRDVVIEHAASTPDVYLHIQLPEASWYHAGSLDRHAALYSPGVRLRLEMGRYVLAEDYIRAMRLREMLVAAVDRAMEGCDALLLPTLPIPAPPLGATSVDVQGSQEPVRAMMLRLTQLFNLTGHPAIALPAPSSRDGLPRSLQLVGRRDGTERLLDVAVTVDRQLAPAHSC